MFNERKAKVVKVSEIQGLSQVGERLGIYIENFYYIHILTPNNELSDENM